MALKVTVNFPDVSQPPPPSRQLYRVKTDREIFEQKIAVPGHGHFWEASRDRPNWREHLPTVFWLFGEAYVQFTEAQQRLAWAMMMDSVDSVKKFGVVYGHTKAFMNGTGFGDPDDPRRNYITGEDLSARLPRWDKVRVCANAVLAGVESGDMLIVDHIPHDNIPTWAEIKDKPWLYFEAVSSTPTGDTTPFPQGVYGPIYIPLIARTEVSFPLSALERL